MGKKGRFGKYGEKKRIDRLRRTAVEKQTCFPPSDNRAVRPRRFGQSNRPGDDVTIRPAEMSDLAAISELSEKGFRQYGPYENILPEWFVAGITRTFLALLGRKAVGFVMLGRLPDKWFYPQITELLAIAVAPEWQRRGIGGRLLGTVLAEAQGGGVEQVVLHTAVGNSSGQRLFRKYGFVSAGKKRCFYPAGQDAIMMYKNVG